MDSGYYAAVNGAKRTEMRLEVLANNLANVNTSGYKQDRITFNAFMTSPGPEQYPLPNDAVMGLKGPAGTPFPYSNPASYAYQMTYPAALATSPDLSEGVIKATGNPLDVAIDGPGYFVIDTPQGRRYTRDGSFSINTDGEMVTKEGFRVLGEGDTPLQVGSGSVEISADGTVATKQGAAGRLQRVDLPSIAMKKVGNNQYTAPREQEKPIFNELGGFHQGFLEGSNAEPIHNMTEMIEANRAFETYMKMIQAMDGLDNHAANDIGRVG